MKTTIKSLLIVMAFVCGSCSDNEPDEITGGNSFGTVKITETELNFTAAPGEGYIKYETKEAVTVTVQSQGEEEWCFTDKNVEGEIRVNVYANLDISARSALISLKSTSGAAYVSVVQSGDRVILYESEVELDKEGNEKHIFVYSQMPFQVLYDEEWLEHRIEGDRVYFWSEYNTDWDRESRITILSQSGIEESILVWQHGKAVSNSLFMRSSRWYFNENRMSATIKQGFDAMHVGMMDVSLYVGNESNTGQGIYAGLQWVDQGYYRTGYNFSYDPVSDTKDELLISQHYRHGNGDNSHGGSADFFWAGSGVENRRFITFIPLLTEDQGNDVLSKVWRLEILEEDNPIDVRFVDPNDNDIWFVLSTEAYINRPQ